MAVMVIGRCHSHGAVSDIGVIGFFVRKLT